MSLASETSAYWNVENDGTDVTGHGNTLTQDSGGVTYQAAVVGNGVKKASGGALNVALFGTQTVYTAPGTRDFAVWGWAKVPSTATNQHIIAGSGSGGGVGDWALVWESVGASRFLTFLVSTGGGVVNARSSIVPMANTWYFVRGEREGTVTRCYVNNGNLGTGGISGSLALGSIGADLTICQRVLADHYCDELGMMIGRLPTSDEWDCLYSAGDGTTWPYNSCGNRSVWQVRFGARQNDQPLSGVSWGTPTEFIFQDPIAGQVYIQEKGAVDLNGVAAGKQMFVEARRIGEDFSSLATNTANEVLLGVELEFDTDQNTIPT